MKKYFLLTAFLFLGVLFTSCNKEPIAEVILDSDELKTEMKNLTIGMYNSRNTSGIKPSSVGSFNLTPTEKTLLANTALNLLKSYGLTEAEINTNLGGITEEKLIDVAYSIIDIEEQASRGIELVDPVDGVSLLTGEFHVSDIAQAIRPSSQVFDCAMQALGISVVFELMEKGIEKMGKAAVRKLLAKVATKYLSWVGVAIAVYEFGDCMDWW
jgi:hypothetical protein